LAAAARIGSDPVLARFWPARPIASIVRFANYVSVNLGLGYGW
jgi:hypothetical protein